MSLKDQLRVSAALQRLIILGQYLMGADDPLSLSTHRKVHSGVGRGTGDSRLSSRTSSPGHTSSKGSRHLRSGTLSSAIYSSIAACRTDRGMSPPSSTLCTSWH
jgi:hypothetical protein